MKTVLSYCLFDPFNIHVHRTWDEHNLDKTRYWFNIPALYITNKVLYPDYEMKIFINNSLTYNPLFKLLEKLDITIEEVDLKFTNTSEPMMWRLIPIWDGNYDCVFLRDIDSIPNYQEYVSTPLASHGCPAQSARELSFTIERTLRFIKSFSSFLNKEYGMTECGNGAFLFWLSIGQSRKFVSKNKGDCCCINV